MKKKKTMFTISITKYTTIQLNIKNITFDITLPILFSYFYMQDNRSYMFENKSELYQTNFADKRHIEKIKQGGYVQ